MRLNGQKFTIPWAETCFWPSVYERPSPLLSVRSRNRLHSLATNGRPGIVSRNCVLESRLFERLFHSETKTLYERRPLTYRYRPPMGRTEAAQIFLRITYISINTKSQEKFEEKFLILRGYNAEGVYHFQKGLSENFIDPLFIS